MAPNRGAVARTGWLTHLAQLNPRLARSELLNAYRKAGSVNGAAKALGIHRVTLLSYVRLLKIQDEWHDIGQIHCVIRSYDEPARGHEKNAKPILADDSLPLHPLLSPKAGPSAA